MVDILDIINDPKAMKAVEPAASKVAPHPSDFFVRNCLPKAKGLTHKVIAGRLGVSPKHLSRFINGHVDIEVEFAIRLEKGTGYSAKTWLALQNRYSLYKASLRNIEAQKIYA